MQIYQKNYLQDDLNHLIQTKISLKSKDKRDEIDEFLQILDRTDILNFHESPNDCVKCGASLRLTKCYIQCDNVTDCPFGPNLCHFLHFKHRYKSFTIARQDDDAYQLDFIIIHLLKISFRRDDIVITVRGNEWDIIRSVTPCLSTFTSVSEPKVVIESNRDLNTGVVLDSNEEYIMEFTIPHCKIVACEIDSRFIKQA